MTYKSVELQFTLVFSCHFADDGQLEYCPAVEILPPGTTYDKGMRFQLDQQHSALFVLAMRRQIEAAAKEVKF